MFVNASKRALEAMKTDLGTFIAPRSSQGRREAPECVLVGGEIRQWGGFESHGDETRSAVVMKSDERRTL